MNADMLFNVTCLMAAAGWIILIFASPYWKNWDKFVIGVIIALLSVFYSYCNFSNPDPDILKKFSSLEGILQLFQNKMLLLAAWLHIMAFDLLAAVWMKKNSARFGIKHGWMVPVMIFTCLLGPLGFLMYLVLRWVKSKTFFAGNESGVISGI